MLEVEEISSTVFNSSAKTNILVEADGNKKLGGLVF
jgi:hypothetical protein